MLVLLSACDWDVVEKHYATRAEASHKGTWVPEWVPAAASNIRDVHNLDTNDQTLTFSVPPSDIEPMVTGLLRLKAQDVEAAGQLANELGWNDDGPSQHKLEAFYVCPPSTAAVLIVDRKSGRALYKQTVMWAFKPCGHIH